MRYRIGEFAELAGVSTTDIEFRKRATDRAVGNFTRRMRCENRFAPQGLARTL